MLLRVEISWLASYLYLCSAGPGRQGVPPTWVRRSQRDQGILSIPLQCRAGTPGGSPPWVRRSQRAGHPYLYLSRAGGFPLLGHVGLREQGILGVNRDLKNQCYIFRICIPPLSPPNLQSVGLLVIVACQVCFVSFYVSE